MTVTADPSAAGETMLRDERVRADRVLSLLLLAHFPFALGLAAVHGYWVVAIVAGAVLSFGPWLTVRAMPGTLTSRLVVSAAFMGYAGLFIQEAHGVTEAHFDVFAGLAFLLLYRDWRAPAFGGLVIAVHHLAFHLLQAAGTGVWVFTSHWSHSNGLAMVAVHGGFVVFEVAVLIYISLALEAETRQQAGLISGQEEDHAAMLALAEGLQSRDLTVGSTATGQQSNPALSTLRVGIDHVAELVSAIQRTAADVASASKEMASTTVEAERATTDVAESLTEMADGAERQVHAVGSALDQVQQVGEAVASSADGAIRTAQAASRVQEAAEQGIEAAAEATAAVDAVRGSSEEASRAIDELASKSERISAIVETITGIASQTNLLALNAAIEAARAGESGRGFAVVAEEVRKLAEESQSAAGTISEIVQEIQAETKLAVTVVQDGASRTGESAATVERTREAFERISDAVTDMTQQAQDISRATEQISAGAERMRAEMGDVAKVAEQASAATERASASTQQASGSTQHVAASAEMLSRAAQELQDLVGSFRLHQAD